MQARLTNVSIQNFLGIKRFNADFDAVNLIAGFNGSGKSSIQEAIRMALTGETVRVKLKGDYAELINGVSKKSEVCVWTHDENGAIPHKAEISKTKSGIDAPIEDEVLKCLLDMYRFSSMSLSERRVLLFRLLGIDASVKAICERMVSDSCNAEMTSQIAPFLKIGWDEAFKEAESHVKEARGEWKGITGETYGEQKGENYEARQVEIDKKLFNELVSRETVSANSLEEIKKELALSKAVEQIQGAGKERIPELKKIADKLEERTVAHQTTCNRLDILKSEMAELRKLTNQKGPKLYTCPSCGSELALNGGDLELHADDNLFKEQVMLAKLTLANNEQEWDQLSSLVNVQMKEKTESADAAREIERINSIKEVSQEEIDKRNKLQIRLESEKTNLENIHTELHALRQTEHNNKMAVDRTERAYAAHKAVLEWAKIKEALSPDGIQAQLLEGSIGAFNKMLSEIAAPWSPVSLMPDTTILYDGRPYYLCSESEKWRANATIMAVMAKLKWQILVLDRVDVLGVETRGDFLSWTESLASAGVQSILFATLKGPANLEGIQCLWLENGELV